MRKGDRLSSVSPRLGYGAEGVGRLAEVVKGKQGGGGMDAKGAAGTGQS